VTTHGAPVLLGLAPGSDEGTDPRHGFLEDLTSRRLHAPLLVTTDGAPGLIGAVQLAFPRSLRQRCSANSSACSRSHTPAGCHSTIRR
jgi:putative transposase